MTSNGIRIVADSVCDLPSDIVKALGVYVIPTYVNIGEQSIPDDGISLDRRQFYRDLPTMRTQPSTAAPSPGDAEAFYRKIFADGAQHIISIHVPGQLSGVLNTMRLGAKAVAENAITLVDSYQLGMGIGFQVWIAAELAAADIELDFVLDAIERVRKHTRVYAIIDTLEYMRRSGRVNPLIANFGTLLKIKPMVQVEDGEIRSLARLRTWSRAVARLSELTREQAPIERLAIFHIDNLPAAESFRDSLREILPQKTVIVEVSPTLGTHIGPGSIGVATLNRNWRQ